MPSMLIAFHTRTNHTRHMAEAIAKGAQEIDGITVDVELLKDVEPKDMVAYDAIVLGSPTYYGTMAAEMKKFIDDSVAFHGQLRGKVGGAFSSSAHVGGGNETTIFSILNALMIHGMVVQGMCEGDHYGPVAIGDVDDRAKKQCLRYGKQVASLAVKLAAAD